MLDLFGFVHWSGTETPILTRSLGCRCRLVVVNVAHSDICLYVDAPVPVQERLSSVDNSVTLDALAEPGNDLLACPRGWCRRRCVFVLAPLPELVPHLLLHIVVAQSARACKLLHRFVKQFEIAILREASWRLLEVSTSRACSRLVASSVESACAKSLVRRELLTTKSPSACQRQRDGSSSNKILVP